MARLTDLANELILEILKHVSPSDVEAFCHLSKSILMVTASFLAEHREIKRKYWTWSDLNDGTALDNTHQPVDLLRDIFQKPQVAAYVLRLHFKGYSYRSPTEGEDSRKLQRNAIQYSEVLSEAEKRVWLEDGTEECLWEDRCVALLLPLLPNLEKLRLWGLDAWPIMKMMAKISKATLLPGLKKLKAIDLRGIGGELTEVECNDLLNSLITLPALEQLSISGLATSKPTFGSDEDSSPLFLHRRSSINRIWINECSFEWPMPLTILNSSDCLTSFTYYWGCESELTPTPRSLCEALLSQAGSTLKYLKLMISTTPRELVGSLRDFKVLEHVVTNRELLIDEKCPSWAQKLPTTILSLDLYDDGYVPNKFSSSDVQKLTSDTVRLMEELLSHRWNEVPKLEKVQYMLGEDMVADLSDGIVKLMKYYLEREFCGAGIQFVLEGQPGYFLDFLEKPEAEKASGWDTEFN